MINIETLISIAGALGGLEAIKWIIGLKNSRKKAEADTEDTIATVIAKRSQTYEESITFLQGQLRDKEQQFAELSEKYQSSMTHALELTRQLGEMKLKYRSARCDRKDCLQRKPPFRWMKFQSKSGPKTPKESN